MNTFTDDDWLTPPDILKSLGRFDLDPCAPENRPWDMAGVHLTRTNNGLGFAWNGRVWLNPPYSKRADGKSQVEEWMRRMAAHQNGIALTNVRTETKWFFNHVWNSAHAVFFFKARLKFFRPDGTVGETGKNASVLAAYSPADAAAIYQAGLDGKFIPLIVTFSAELKTSWRQLVRWLLKECGGLATLEQLYELASGHPKLAANKHWQAKIRQQVRQEGRRVGPGLWQLALV